MRGLLVLTLSFGALVAVSWATWFEVHPGPWGSFAFSVGSTALLLIGVAATMGRPARPPPGRPPDPYELAESGVLSRVSFEESLRRECARSASLGQPTTVAILSVQTPRKLLTAQEWQEMSKVVVSSAARLVRSADVIGHLGGLEYAFCFPHTAISGAELALRRLEDDLQAYSPSIGLAAYGEAGTSPDDLMDAARRDAIHRPLARQKRRPWHENVSAT